MGSSQRAQPMRWGVPASLNVPVRQDHDRSATLVRMAIQLSLLNEADVDETMAVSREARWPHGGDVRASRRAPHHSVFRPTRIARARHRQEVVRRRRRASATKGAWGHQAAGPFIAGGGACLRSAWL